MDNLRLLSPNPQVRVYFDSLEVKRVIEIPRWTPEDILMGLGGTLSLFLGISFVAALEFVELLVRLIVAAIPASIFPNKNVARVSNAITRGTH